MAFDLPPELVELQATVRKMAQEKVAPRAREIDTTAAYPQDLFELFRDTGLLGLVIPEEYGGSGAGILGLTVAMEEVAKYSNTAALMLLLTRLPTGPVLIAGSEKQKNHYVRGVATGDMRAGFGLSEPQAGSDVVGMRTKAVPGRRHLGAQRHQVLDVGRRAGRLVLRVRQDRSGRLAFARRHLVLHRRTLRCPACRSGAPTTRWACAASTPVSWSSTTSACLPTTSWARVGGFRLAMLGLNSMRPVVAARGIGLAEGALMYAVEYVKQRAAFGKTIADMQGIQWKIAELATEIEAARLLTYRAATMADEGKYTKEYVPFLSMAKYYATEVAVKVSDEAHADARRGRIHERPHDRALLP